MTITATLQPHLKHPLLQQPETRTIAIPAGAGSFHHQALEEHYPEAFFRVKHYANAVDACKALSGAEANFILLAISNTLTGPISEHWQLLRYHRLEWVQDHALRVTQTLMAPQGLPIDQIQKVVSHPAALEQCAQLIKSKGWETQVATDTTEAARLASSVNNTAAIGPQNLAHQHGLQILMEDASDTAENYTRFALLWARPIGNTGASL